jgi:hypothetical protein
MQGRTPRRSGERLGELVVLGHAGPEVLDGVLHVPDLVVSLFSVRAALA